VLYEFYCGIQHKERRHVAEIDASNPMVFLVASKTRKEKIFEHSSLSFCPAKACRNNNYGKAKICSKITKFGWSHGHFYSSLAMPLFQKLTFKN